MKTIRQSFLIITILTSLSMVSAQTVLEKIQIETEDIQNLIGEWNGTLTYLDYSSNKPFSMPSELKIKSKRKHRKLILNYTYPNEPKANNKNKFKISKDRTIVNGKQISSRSETTDGDTQIVTEFYGKDGNDNKKALIRNVYIIGINKFVIRKEVQFKDSKEWVMRNEYSFVKK